MPKDGKAIVDGVNIAIRHTKQSQQSQGGRIPKAMPIELSNLALLDKNGKADPRRLPRWKTARRCASPRPRGT